MEMKTISVKIKGIGSRDTTKRLFTSEADLATLPLDEHLKLVNYAEDLKRRAKLRGEFTDSGAKQRESALMLIQKRRFTGDDSFWKQYSNLTDGKAKKGYLDEMYAEETDECDEVAGGK